MSGKFDPKSILSKLNIQTIQQKQIESDDKFDPKSILEQLRVETPIKDESIIDTRVETPIKDESIIDTLKDIDLSRTFKSAIREVKSLKEIVPFAKDVAIPGLIDMFNTMKSGTPEEKIALYEKSRKGLMSIPGLVKLAVIDTASTFGSDLTSEDKAPNLRFATEKWQNAPIQSVLDATGLASVLKGTTKSIFKSTLKAAKPKNKKIAQEIISKGDIETKQLLKNVSNTEVTTVLDDLYDESSIIKKLSISNQLDNPNYAQEVGKNAANNINRLKKRDQNRLKSAIKKIKDNVIDKSEIADDIADRLQTKGFLKNGNVLDVENIEPGLSKAQLTKEVKKISDLDSMTAGELKLRMDSIDDKINWKNPKTADEGLIEIRRVYRNKLRDLSGEYDSAARLVSEKLDLFEPQLRRLEKVGAGEKLGKNLFQTKEELDEFIKLMDKTPDKLAGSINADLKTLKAWHAWNRYFKQNPDFIIGNIPGISGKVIPAIKKRVIKGKVNLGVPRSSKLFKRTKELPLLIGTRAGLELSDVLNEGDQ